MAIFFAFCCLGCSAVNDFVFKLFARKERSRGLFVALIGIVWLLPTLFMTWDTASDIPSTWLWGAVSGFFSVTANLLLIEAMSKESAGVCSTIYRLNLVLVVAGAYFLLDEPISVLQLCGVFFAIAAILAFFPLRRRLHLHASGAVLVIIAAILRAGMGLTYKFAFLNHADRNGIVLVNSLFWIAGGLFYALAREKRIPLPDPKMWRYSIISGLLVVGIVFFMAASLQYGDASVVLPIAQMSFLGTFALGALILKESITINKVIAVICGVIAIILLTL